MPDVPFLCPMPDLPLPSELPFMDAPGLEAVGGFAHRLLLRHPSMAAEGERDEVIERLRPWHEAHIREMGFDASALALAEQVHGADVAVVTPGASGIHPAVDGLVSCEPGVLLGIFVADCCAVYLVDPDAGAYGLVHSGKKGSEAGIVKRALASMCELGASRERIRVSLSPCIRPPAYEVDFASLIHRDCMDEGIRDIHFTDHGTCTSSDLRRFYSYRIEKGSTGRMLALLGRA